MKRGLTLVEVLIAVTIFSLISVSLYSLLHTGIKVRKKITQDERPFKDVYLRLEAVARELRNIISFKEDAAQLSGNKGRIEFYTLVFDYLTDAPKILNIIYEFKEGVLTKTTKEPLEEEEEEAIATLNFIEGLEQFNFYYFDPEEEEEEKWQDTWEEKERLPQGVKVELVFKDQQDRQKVLDKYVFIYR